MAILSAGQWRELARTFVIASFAILIVTACVLSALGAEAKSDGAMLAQKLVLGATAVAGIAGLLLGANPLDRKRWNWPIAVAILALAVVWLIIMQAHRAAAEEVVRVRAVGDSRVSREAGADLHETKGP